MKFEIPNYNPGQGIEYKWEDGFEIKVTAENNSVTIAANKAGLLSLANHLLNLAQDAVPAGSHFHLDEFNSLVEGSIELIIEKSK